MIKSAQIFVARKQPEMPEHSIKMLSYTIEIKPCNDGTGPVVDVPNIWYKLGAWKFEIKRMMKSIAMDPHAESAYMFNVFGKIHVENRIFYE